MLRITVHDGVDQVRLKLEGDLSGPWVRELEDCWRATSPTLAGRALCLDLTEVCRVDVAGTYLLALLRGAGAQLVASGAATTHLVETIAANWPGSDKSQR